MSRKSQAILIFFLTLLSACQQGFERFAPPANSISGRGAKVNPKILSTTPTSGATVSPVTGVNGTEIKVVFDMTMRTDLTPVINTYAYDVLLSPPWLKVANSGYTWNWSSTNLANDTLTFQLGWVRWPENNIIGFDFDNNSLVNLDDMPVINETRLSFTVSWETGRYKVVPTGQGQCYGYNILAPTPTPGPRWDENCSIPTAPLGSTNFPAGQNYTVDPTGPMFNQPPRFPEDYNPQSISVIGANCSGTNPNAPCYPYSVDAATTLVWKTCSQGQAYDNNEPKCWNSGNDYTWGDAVNACASLNTANSGQGYGGRKDWRLPTVQELESLIDYGIRTQLPNQGSLPRIAGFRDGGTGIQYAGAFPNTSVSKAYWTATGGAQLYSGTTNYTKAWVVDFSTGYLGSTNANGLIQPSRATSNRNKVRCVAGPTVLPQAQTLTPSVRTAPAAANLTAATMPFTGFTTGNPFTLSSAIPKINGVTHVIKLDITGIPANVLNYSGQAGLSTRYCIALASDPDCSTPDLTILTALESIKPGDNSVTLITTTPPLAATRYTVYVSPFDTSPSGTIALTNNRATFYTYTLATFDVSSVYPASATSAVVVFNQVPNATDATNLANYCISTNPASCSLPGDLTISAATVSGNRVTLTTATQTPGATYYVYVSGIQNQGQNIVTDTLNKLVWKRCKHGALDTSNCANDGDTDDDTLFWAQALNYCASLNTANYANYSSGWRAPTINELKSIANRSLANTALGTIDTTVFPAPDTLTDFFSSTNVVNNGDPEVVAASMAWLFQYDLGVTASVAKDYISALGSYIATGGSSKSIRCVRSLP